MQKILSEESGLGRVMMCGECDDIHVSVGRTSFRLPKETFMALARMMTSAAAHPDLTEASRFSITFEDGVPSFAPIQEA